MAWASVAKNIELFGVGKCTLSKLMTSFEKEGKTSSLKENSAGNRILSDIDCRILSRIVRKDTNPNITVELNGNVENPVSSKTVRMELYKAGFHRRDAIKKLLFSDESFCKSSDI